jgi:hypothetical protein
LPERDLAELLGADPEVIADRLVIAALQEGAEDKVTAETIEVSLEDRACFMWAETRHRSCQSLRPWDPDSPDFSNRSTIGNAAQFPSFPDQAAEPIARTR